MASYRDSYRGKCSMGKTMNHTEHWKCLLFFLFMPNHRNNICEYYKYFSRVMSLVVQWACVHCLMEINTYTNNVSNTLVATLHSSMNIFNGVYPVLWYYKYYTHTLQWKWRGMVELKCRESWRCICLHMRACLPSLYELVCCLCMSLSVISV